jgi:hypothetical protein
MLYFSCLASTYIETAIKNVIVAFSCHAYLKKTSQEKKSMPSMHIFAIFVVMPSFLST